ncbi:MAG: IS4 family transposase [Myxococcales bacterium]
MRSSTATPNCSTTCTATATPNRTSEKRPGLRGLPRAGPGGDHPATRRNAGGSGAHSLQASSHRRRRGTAFGGGVLIPSGIGGLHPPALRPTSVTQLRFSSGPLQASKGGLLLPSAAAPNYGKLSTALKALLPAAVLSHLARTLRFVRRARMIEAPAFVWALVMSRFAPSTPGFACARQNYKRLTGRAPEPRPFQLRVSSAAAVRVLEATFERIAAQWRAARPVTHKLRCYFADIVVVDSTVMRVDDALAKYFKGLRGIRAQIKLLFAVSAFGSLPLFAKLGEGAESDSKIFPTLSLFRAKTLWLFDRGFLDFRRFREIDGAEQYFLCQSKKNTNAIVTAIHDGPAWARRRLARNPGLKLRDLIPADKLVLGRTWDVDVLLTSHKAGRSEPVKARLVVVPREKDRKPVGYLTNLPRTLWKPRVLRELYRLRWQIRTGLQRDEAAPQPRVHPHQGP